MSGGPGDQPLGHVPGNAPHQPLPGGRDIGRAEGREARRVAARLSAAQRRLGDAIVPDVGPSPQREIASTPLDSGAPPERTSAAVRLRQRLSMLRGRRPRTD